MATGKKTNLLALALILPMLILYMGYLVNHTPGLSPTGFFTYDNVSYVAYGKQYLDTDEASLFYANPLNEQAYPAVYFQPQSVLFALLMKLGVPPGAILIPFTLICAFLGFRLMISLYDQLQPENRHRTLHVWLICWGGGLLCFGGLTYHLTAAGEGSIWSNLFALDPDHGWWGLNWGRALFFSCEAYYHLLFIACILGILNRKWKLALALIFVLSVSHPFTGLELIGIVCAFCLWELLVNRKSMPYWFAFGCLAALVFHLWYYFVFMAQAPDYISVRDQYTLNWRMRWYRMLPAYILPGALAITAILHKGARKFFQERTNRLFASWFLVAFFLINHELFMTARQPVHFTRGYVWTSLMLLGVPALSQLTATLRNKMTWLVYVLAIVFFTDNFLWIGRQVSSRAMEPYYGYMSATQKEVLLQLGTRATNRSLVVSSHTDIAYFASVYTPAWPWYSHPFTTPFAERKKQAQDNFLMTGEFAEEWKGREVFFVLQNRDTIALKRFSGQKPVYQNSDYRLYRSLP